MYCPCGAEDNNTSGTPYSFVGYNSKGEIVYAVCVHGFVVINLGEENENPGVGG
jgi:hypothetical protein